MSDIFMGDIAAFAKTGGLKRIVLPSLPPWPRYDAARGQEPLSVPRAFLFCSL